MLQALHLKFDLFTYCISQECQAVSEVVSDVSRVLSYLWTKKKRRKLVKTQAERGKVIVTVARVAIWYQECYVDLRTWSGDIVQHWIGRKPQFVCDTQINRTRRAARINLPNPKTKKERIKTWLDPAWLEPASPRGGNHFPLYKPSICTSH